MQRFWTIVRRHWVIVTVAVAVLAAGGMVTAVAASGRDDVVAPPPSTNGTPAAAPTSARKPTPKPSPQPPRDSRPREPLTGRLTKNPAALQHPAVAIKISDAREAHPQISLDQADIVFVEPIGPSYTRLAAVFHSKLPTEVGPIRSVRPVDAPLLGPLKCVFGNSMAAPWVMNYVDESSDVDNLGTLRVRVDSGAYTIAVGRISPNHVIAHPRSLMKVSRFTAPPTPYFGYGYTADEVSIRSSKKAATRISIPYGQGFAMSYSYDTQSKRYLRSEPWGPHVMADGTRISATNVVIIKVASRVGKIGHGGGAPVPILALNHGQGSFFAMTGGKQVSGTWTKGTENQPFTFTTSDGKPLRLAPGSTWVELPDLGARVAVR